MKIRKLNVILASAVCVLLAVTLMTYSIHFKLERKLESTIEGNLMLNERVAAYEKQKLLKTMPTESPSENIK